MAAGEIRVCEKQGEGEMAGLCASHMNTLGRWERLMQMLTSWRKRTVPLEVPLMVSVLFDKGVEGGIRLPEMEGLTIIGQRQKMS